MPSFVVGKHIIYGAYMSALQVKCVCKKTRGNNGRFITVLQTTSHKTKYILKIWISYSFNYSK